MTPEKRHHEVWAQLLLSRADEARVRAFLEERFGVRPDRIARRMHLTVYHARRPMPEVQTISERAEVCVLASDTRFMVLAPGGENPRPELEPAFRKVGIRVRRNTDAMATILRYRSRLMVAETASVLGTRKPSDHRRNAFGARHFQPHVTLLKPGSGVDRDLTKIGTTFRAAFGTLKFDRFIVDAVEPHREDGPPNGRVGQTAGVFGNSIRWADRRGHAQGSLGRRMDREPGA